jgi:hypothetical protein
MRPPMSNTRTPAEILGRIFLHVALGLGRLGAGRAGSWRFRLAFRILPSLLALGLVAVGCGSPVSVRAAYDPSAPFASYQTFAMIEPNRAVPTGLDSDPFFMRQLRQLTYQALMRRGLRPVTVDQAQVVVGVQARFQDRIAVDSMGGPYPGGPGYSGYGYYGYGPRYGAAWGGTYVDKYSEAQVAIDLIDPKANEVRWRGYGARRADRPLTAAEMNEMVERILSMYPPGQDK